MVADGAVRTRQIIDLFCENTLQDLLITGCGLCSVNISIRREKRFTCCRRASVPGSFSSHPQDFPMPLKTGHHFRTVC